MLRCLSAFPAALNTMVDNEERARGAGGEPPEERRELMVKVFRTTAGVNSLYPHHLSFPAVREMAASVGLELRV